MCPMQLWRRLSQAIQAHFENDAYEEWRGKRDEWKEGENGAKRRANRWNVKKLSSVCTLALSMSWFDDDDDDGDEDDDDGERH